MKLATKDIEPFCRNVPAPIRAVLVYGADGGRVDEVALGIAKQRAEDLHDTFNVHTFHGDEILADDNAFFAAALSPALMGGRPLIKVRGAGNKLTPTLKTLLGTLTANDAFILLTAGELDKKSSLRTLFEGSTADIAAVPCYEDDARSMETLLRQFAASENITISSEAGRLLQQSLGTNRLQVRQELTKLKTYLGNRTHLEAADVEAAGSNIKHLGFEDVAYNALEGNPTDALRAWHLLQLEGESPITLLRALQNLLLRLLWVQGETVRGQPLELVLKKLQPPLFYKIAPRFQNLLRRWSPAMAEQALERTMQQELASKSGTLDADLAFAQFIVQLTHFARSSGRAR